VVNDAMITGATEDPVLRLLIDLTVSSIVTGRPLFTNPLQEPMFYARHFQRWVQEGIEDAAQIEKVIEKGTPEALKK
jgi:hypothetical protein